MSTARTKCSIEEYHQRLEAAGHLLLRRDDGKVDWFVLDAREHNGPACVRCGCTWCHHYQPEIRECPAKPSEAPDAGGAS